MQTPVEIDFQGLQPSAAVQDTIRADVERLERRFGRITACRVVVKGPGHHHRTGLFEVNIHLALPQGREVAVVRTPKEDERYTDLDFALNDTFRRARRRLQDQIRRMTGAVKAHESAPAGTVARLDHDGAFGFLVAGDGHEVYFHRNSVLDGEFSRLKAGTRVTFVEEPGAKGPQASTVRILGRHGMRP